MILTIATVLTLILCELALRCFFEQPSNVIINLSVKSNDNYDSQHVTLTEHPEEGGVYIETSAGRRLRPNTNIIIKNHSLSKREIKISINSLGYRNPELKNKTKKRILFLGDSITFGDYLAETETFVRLVENIYNTKNSNPQNQIETINAGVGSIGLESEIAILKETGLSVKPDIVILDFYLNDFEQSPGVKLLKVPKLLNNLWLAHYAYKTASIIRMRLSKNANSWENPRKLRIWMNEIKNSSATANSNTSAITLSDTITAARIREQEEFNNLIIRNIRDWGLAWSATAWNDMQPFFDELKHLSDRHHFKLMFIAFPVAEQVKMQFVDDFPQRKLRETAKRLNIPFLDMLPTLRTAYQKTYNITELFYDHCHHTPAGNLIIANTISNFINNYLADNSNISGLKNIPQ
ncbi:MAG TPA: SGNH/GDSL hydrolase family protein [bacterium]|nr:SGNH/GDSL hydrolase family protein [bacterium]HOL47317.1 SGNH/GDSL hydrolase family protein [bacterium]HPQ17979.1 SGNH/GDSL hydrolase family protein [bacterium]